MHPPLPGFRFIVTIRAYIICLLAPSIGIGARSSIKNDTHADTPRLLTLQSYMTVS